MNSGSEKIALHFENDAFNRKLEAMASYVQYGVLFGAPLILLALLFLILETIYVLIPYTCLESFTKTICNVEKVEIDHKSVLSCSGTKDTFSSCVKVFVRYATGLNRMNESQEATGILIENREALLHCNSCSFTFGRHGLFYSDKFECEMWRENFNRSMCVDKFLMKYGRIRESYPCFFNPQNRNQVILTSARNSIRIIHAYVWPLLLCIVYILSLVVVFYSHKQKTLKKKLLTQRIRQRKSFEIARDLKKEQLNRSLGVQSSDRRRKLSEARNTTLKSVSSSGDLEASSQFHSDMRHLDLAITEQNVDNLVLAHGYVTSRRFSTLPRKAEKRSDVSRNPFRSATLFTCNHDNIDPSNLYTLPSHDDVVSNTNMLTELEIDLLFRARAYSTNLHDYRMSESSL